MSSKNIPVTGDASLKEDQLLMRYMDFPKFIDMIRTSEIYLASALEFDDRLEGTLPEAIRDMYVHDPEVISEFGKVLIQEREYLNKVITNISCWSKGSGDNMALWKIYGGSKQSVAVMTNFDRMVQLKLNMRKTR